MWRTVMRPVLLRPPLRFLETTNERSGFSVVISSNALTVLKRVPGVIGLYLLIAIISPFLYARLSKNAIALESFLSCTYAFLYLLV